MRTVKLILALCAFFVLAGALAACGSDVPGDSVADVAGNPITRQTFNHWLYVAAKGNAAQSPGAPVIIANDPPDFKNCIAQVRKQIPMLAKTPDKQIRTDCNELFTSLGSQVMDFLIKAEWYQAEAAKRHITVTNKQVQQAFQVAEQQQFTNPGELQTFLAQSGQTMQDLLFRVRINQILKQLLAQQQKAGASPAAIQAYFNSHRSQFAKAETRSIRIVRTHTAAQAAAAKAALGSGQSWQQVAKKYSVDTATRNNGGILKNVARGQQEQALDQAAFSAPANKVTGVIHGTFGYYVFEVTSINPATQQTLAQATPLIKQLLQSQGQQAAQTALDAQAKKNWQHQTTCQTNFVTTPDCSNYKAPKTKSNASSGAASSSAASSSSAP